MQRNFDWDLLRSFLAVARTGKLTTAAQKLKVDHSTLSRRISSLEASLNARLFDRGLTGYRLTADGERLLIRAEAIESDFIGIHKDVGGESSQVSGIVRIGAPDGFGTMFLAPRLDELAGAHPELEIELVGMPRGFSLTKREADIAISLSEPPRGRVQTQKLTSYALGLYGAKHQEMLWGDLRGVNDLADLPFIGYIDDLIFAPELDYLPQVSRSIRAKLRSSNLLAQVEATAAGAGLCILPAFIAGRDPRLVRLLASEIRLVRTFWMSVNGDVSDLARVRVTTRFIAEIAKRSTAIFLPDD